MRACTHARTCARHGTAWYGMAQHARDGAGPRHAHIRVRPRAHRVFASGCVSASVVQASTPCDRRSTLDVAKDLATNLLIHQRMACETRSSQEDCIWEVRTEEDNGQMEQGVQMKQKCRWESGRCMASNETSKGNSCPCIKTNGLKTVFRDYGRCIGECVEQTASVGAVKQYSPRDWGTKCQQWDLHNTECTSEEGNPRPSASTWCWSVSLCSCIIVASHIAMQLQ